MIRAILPGDADFVAALIRTAFAAIGTPLDPPPSGQRVNADQVRQHLETGGGALHDEAGCILWAVKGAGLYVSRLAVLPAHRGQGIGSALLAHAEAQARRLGQPRIHLEVRLALTGNRLLFARAGFVETVQRSHPGYAHPTFVEAEKRL